MRNVILFALAFAVMLFSGCQPGGQLVPPTHHLGAYAPLPTDANLQPAWFIDPQNLTGCATDNPQTAGPTPVWGTSATCTGSNGPLKSWYGLSVQRWNCFGVPMGCPRLRQATTVTFLSAHTDNTDPVAFNPAVENNAYAALVGTPVQTCTGALTALTALNRATPQLLNVTFPASCTALAAGQLVVNSTHPSEAFTYTNSSGLAWNMTQPLASAVLPGGAAPAEVTTWANADVVTVFTLPNVNLVSFQALVSDQNTFGSGSLQKLNIWNPGTLAVTQLSQIYAQDVGVSRTVSTWSSGSLGGVFANSFQSASVAAAQPSYLQFSEAWLGGAVLGGLNGSWSMGNDAIIAANSTIFAPLGNQLTQIYVETSKVLTADGGGSIKYINANSIMYGPGTLNVQGATRFVYTTGAGKAAAGFLQTGGLQLNGQTKYITELPSSATGIVTGNTTLTAAALDTSFGATSGCACSGNSCICNY